ncbi:hypothetical protein [Streptomyces cavernae]|nr:hypothetical protein [Streptomyces cavernae]
MTRAEAPGRGSARALGIFATRTAALTAAALAASVHQDLKTVT